MIHVRPMTDADLSLGMRLKARAGWNQTEADWRRAFRLQPDGCFVAELDGAAVGTTTTCLFGSVAWVAMVLVDEAVRGQGVGTALLRHALAFLDERGVRGVRLDATPLGRPLYEKLGFVAEYPLARYEGVPSAARQGNRPKPLPEGLFPQLLRLDRTVTGADRGGFLKRWYEEHRAAFRTVRSGSAVVGYLCSRPGCNATSIGPCLALSGSVGEDLLADSGRRLAGQRVFIDVPLPNRAAIRAVEAMGLTVQRPLLRMGRGEPARECVEALWASSGPEKG